jgi:hypothetical protein
MHRTNATGATNVSRVTATGPPDVPATRASACRSSDVSVTAAGPAPAHTSSTTGSPGGEVGDEMVGYLRNRADTLRNHFA